MREVKQSNEFKRNLRRLSRSIYRELLIMPDGELWEVVRTLAEDKTLPPKYRDHPLRGDREGSRECHVRPDLLLVYKYEGGYLLILDMLGSHAEVFGM